MKYTLDQILEFRLSGWNAEEWVFLPMRDFTFLEGYAQIEKAEHYAGCHGFSVMIVCDANSANDAFLEAEKLLTVGVSNLAIWHTKLPKIAELVMFGHRHKKPIPLPVNDDWALSVQKLSEVNR